MADASPFLGILSLDTRFERVVGDAGNPESYAHPARLRVVRGADAPLLVRDALAPELAARFVRAARDLEAEGAGALVSTCGFLVSAQAEVAAAVRVPVMLSALSLVPWLRAVRPGRIGVLTASAAALGPGALAAAGADAREVAVGGMEGVEAFARTFLAPKAEQPPRLDRAAMERAVAARAAALVREAPDVASILLECGNLPPYRDAIRAAAGRPVFDLVAAAPLLMGGAL